MANNLSQCSTAPLPSTEEFFKATSPYGLLLTSFTSIAFLLTLTSFTDTLFCTLKRAPAKTKALTIHVTALYPIISLSSLTAIVVPRSHLLAETVTQVTLMSAIYQLFNLFMAYCDGEESLITKMKDSRLVLTVAPCCCWPFCDAVLPSFLVDKKSVTSLRLLVLQLPLLQSLVYFVILVLWTESESLYQRTYLYLQPVIITSIFCGIWGMTMTLKLLTETSNVNCLNLTRKFVLLQMVLVLSKLQGLATRSLVWFGWLPCDQPMTSQEYANLIHNALMVIEMAILSFFARRLYKKEVLRDTNKDLGQCVDNLGYI